jgi:hypothetical protein
MTRRKGNCNSSAQQQEKDFVIITEQSERAVIRNK